MTIIKEQITSLSKFLFEQSKSLGMNTPFAKIYKEIEKNYCFYWYHYLNAQLEYMKYWQLKNKRFRNSSYWFTKFNTVIELFKKMRI